MSEEAPTSAKKNKLKNKQTSSPSPSLPSLPSHATQVAASSPTSGGFLPEDTVFRYYNLSADVDDVDLGLQPRRDSVDFLWTASPVASMDATSDESPSPSIAVTTISPTIGHSSSGELSGGDKKKKSISFVLENDAGKEERKTVSTSELEKTQSEGGTLDASSGKMQKENVESEMPVKAIEKESKEGAIEPKKDKDKSGKDDKGKDGKKDKKTKRTVVSVAYKINCISSISSILCTYEVDAKIFYFWDDAKLIGREKNSSVDLENEPGLFNPDIVVTNKHILEVTTSDIKITDSKKGSVKMSIHVKGTCFLTAMELNLFPFDCQNLLISLKPYKLPYEEVILVSKPEDECAMDNNVTQEWEVFGHCTMSDTTDPATSSANKSYSMLSITILVTRRPGWFINNVFFVSLLLLFVSWSTFAMPTGERGEKMAISTSTLLAIIGNKYVVGNLVPKLQYRSLCDQYVDFCFTMQIVGIGSFLIVYEYAHVEVSGIGNLGSLLNEVFFTLQLGATIVFHYWLAWRLQVHATDMNKWCTILLPDHDRGKASAYSQQPQLPGCKFTAIANKNRLDMAKLAFIEGSRKSTRIASFREAHIYGRLHERNNLAAYMFQSVWKAFKKRIETGIKRFNYQDFKIQLRFLEGCRRMTRIASMREAIVYHRAHIRDHIAAQMVQIMWRAYRVRVASGIKRVLSRSPSLRARKFPDK